MQIAASRLTESFPRPLTSFIGREDEIQEITGMLADPDCRLLTLLGPGGIGKTRLAIQAATLAAAEFAHDAHFVNLQPTPFPAALLPAIADAIGLPLGGPTPPDAQLRTYLQQKETLLVLDNFEHLVDGADILSELLHTAPNLKLLVTSREALNLQEEWQYPVSGLAFPTDHLELAWEQSTAVQLFADRARRVRPSFNLSDEAAGVLQICRLVNGTPLALELAASWTKALDAATIAAEIEKNIAFLETNLRNVPERHRSMRAVFNQAWQQLSPAEQEVFRRLAVFRGGFLAKAAQQVTGASLAILSALVDKSLLRWESGGRQQDGHGRYQIHELLRQFASGQLAAAPDDAAQTLAQHSAYYCAFLQRRAAALIGPGQVKAVREITAELENVRAAWSHAVQQADIAAISQAYYSLQIFCDYQGRFREAEKMLATAVTRLQTLPSPAETTHLLAGLHTFLGWIYIRLGHLAQAQAAFTQGQQQYQSLAVTPPPGFARDPLSGLALVANIIGDYQAALAYCQAAQQLAAARQDVAGLQLVWYIWADVLLHQGQYDEARQAAQHGHEACQATGNLWMLAYLLIIMGNIARAQGEYALATQQFQASYDIKDGMNDPEGMALAVNYLAQIAHLQGRYADARELYRRNLAIYREIADQGGLVRTLQGMGDTAVAQREWDTAVACYHEALQISTHMQWEPLILSLLVSIAHLLHAAGDKTRSAALAAFAHQHPAAEQETKTRAAALLPTGKTLPPLPESSASALATQTLAELEMQPLRFPAVGQPAPVTPGQPPGQPLVDPLTGRELEVLRLIAEGLSNQEIAAQLFISVGTVKSYTGAIYSKLAVASRTQAVAQARQLGLIP
ncbi:MAG: tetratricopeptide repeat protein [Ardenticatenaceae bacterium]|nr:tetratricopeptide repeat protein [Ardenticatenaceae bacterium]